MPFLLETFHTYLLPGEVLCLRLNLEEMEILLKILTEFNPQQKGVNEGRTNRTSLIYKILSPKSMIS